MLKFKQGEDRRQALLLPRSIEEYISKDHLARVVLAIVEMLNLDKIIKKFSELGQNAYSPVMLVAILFYGYAIGIRSSRKLSRACEERLDFIYLSANLRPSHKTISEFRRNNLAELRELFKDIVLIGLNLGLVKIGNIKISLDGSKMRANASSKKSKDEDGLRHMLEQVDGQIRGILEEAEEIDQQEDREYGDLRGDELPEELRDLARQRGKLAEAIEELKRKKERMEEILEDKGKITRKEQERIEKQKINLTDSDARYMKERNGCIRSNYNSQICVDEEEQFIVANDVTQDANDKDQLVPMVDQCQDNLDCPIDEVKTDSGYHSIDNLEELSQRQIDGYIDDPNKGRLNNEKHKFDKVNFSYDQKRDVYICPHEKELIFKKEGLKERRRVRIYQCRDCSGCPDKQQCTSSNYRRIERLEGEDLVEANRAKILSDEGKKKYKKRMHTVEPVFGHIKFNLGYRHFLLRGLERVKGEFNLMCIGYNLKKIARLILSKGISVPKGLNKLNYIINTSNILAEVA